METLLHGIRVLDLTGREGSLCCRMLADLGADVIKIEKPAGSDARNVGPFLNDIPSQENSLNWLAYDLNKRGITLDIQTADGRWLLDRLVRTADVIAESFPPGYMDGLGLGYESMAATNPRLVMASISAFGQTGPYRDLQATDIEALGMGGYLHLCGEPERPPLRCSIPQAYLHAASEAAVGIMIALFDREQTGEGQLVDVSTQQSLVAATVQAVSFWTLNSRVLERAGAFRVGLTAGARQRQTWPCKDGLVNFVIYGGLTLSKPRQGLARWMDEVGESTDQVRGMISPTWDTYDMTQDRWESLEAPIGKFFRARTKSELLSEGARRGVAICPVSPPGEIIDSPQLLSREFWLDVERGSGPAIKEPGPCARFSETPCRISRPAPRLGEHNNEILGGELGLAPAQIVALRQAVVV